MLTLVLNLKHRTDRKRAIQDRLINLGLTPVFIEAVNGRAPELADTIQPIASRTGLNPGEIGCYLSHIKAWQHLMASEHDEALLLEDDCLLDPALPRVLEALQHRASDLHVVRLSALRKLVGRHVCQLTTDNALICTTKNPSGTQGYYFTKAGAAMLLKHISEIHRAIDTEMDRYWRWGGQILTLKPSVIYQDQSSASDIGVQARAHPRKKSSDWLGKVRNSLTKQVVTRYMAATHPLAAKHRQPKPPTPTAPFTHCHAGHEKTPCERHKQVLLFLTHQWNATIEERYRHLHAAAAHAYDVRILLDATQPHVKALCHASLGQEAYAEQVFAFTPDSLAKHLPFPMFRDGRLVPGSAHFPVLAFNQVTSYEHHWVIEYDVLLRGEWAPFLQKFETCQAELLCTHVSTKSQSPQWIWWKRVEVPRKYASFVRQHDDELPKAFFPLYRASKQALNRIAAAHQAGLKAHCEIAMPMALWLDGMPIQDMSEIAPLYSEGSLGGSDALPPYSTFRWRPGITPDELTCTPTSVIYHPVK